MFDRDIYTGPVAFCAECTMPIPASWSKRKRGAALAGDILPTGKNVADADNIAKSVADAINTIVYTDDSQVCDWRAIKRYGETPGVWVTVTPYPDAG